jgi:leader peptidase (prepilin peptidase)/N-methyltransferase
VIEALIALVVGLLIGSFLNVCIHRWPRGRSVIRPRSHCVRCRKGIVWYDNIPLVSYVALRGRCRHCHTLISPRYPTVELLTALLFFYEVRTFGFTLTALKMCVLCALAVGLMFCDMEKRLLPDELTKGGIVMGLCFAPFVPVPDFTAHLFFLIARVEVPTWVGSLAESAAGAALPAFFLWFGGWVYFKVRHREGLGFGDVKLIAMVGAFLGVRGALLTLIVGSLAGSLIGYTYIKLTGKDAATYELPFGTFLGAATLVAAMVVKWLPPV